MFSSSTFRASKTPSETTKTPPPKLSCVAGARVRVTASLGISKVRRPPSRSMFKVTVSSASTRIHRLPLPLIFTNALSAELISLARATRVTPAPITRSVTPETDWGLSAKVGAPSSSNLPFALASTVFKSTPVTWSIEFEEPAVRKAKAPETPAMRALSSCSKIESWGSTAGSFEEPPPPQAVKVAAMNPNVPIRLAAFAFLLFHALTIFSIAMSRATFSFGSYRFLDTVIPSFFRRPAAAPRCKWGNDGCASFRATPVRVGSQNGKSRKSNSSSTENFRYIA